MEFIQGKGKQSFSGYIIFIYTLGKNSSMKLATRTGFSSFGSALSVGINKSINEYKYEYVSLMRKYLRYNPKLEKGYRLPIMYTFTALRTDTQCY